MFMLVKIQDSKHKIKSAFVDTCFCSNEKYREILTSVMQKKYPDIKILSIIPVSGEFYNSYKKYNFTTAILFLYQETEKAKKAARKEKIKLFFTKLLRRKSHAC